MKFQSTGWMLCAILAMLAAGCATPNQEPAAIPSSPGDKVQVLRLASKPLAPHAFVPWRAVMDVVNVGAEPLHNIRYTFTNTKSRDEIGRGVIPLLRAHESIHIESDTTRTEKGRYTVEGKVTIPKEEVEASEVDRANNAMTVDVQVVP